MRVSANNCHVLRWSTLRSQDSGSGSSKPGTGGVATQKPERLERRGHGEREPRQVVLTSYWQRRGDETRGASLVLTFGTIWSIRDKHRQIKDKKDRQVCLYNLFFSRLFHLKPVHRLKLHFLRHPRLDLINSWIIKMFTRFDFWKQNWPPGFTVRLYIMKEFIPNDKIFGMPFLDIL